MADRSKKDSDKQSKRDTYVVKLERGAQKAFIEELFNDIYAHRLRIYVVNFIRGVSFSVGGIIGATLVIALILWLLSLFSNVPVIGNFFHQTQETIQQGTQKVTN